MRIFAALVIHLSMLAAWAPCLWALRPLTSTDGSVEAAFERIQRVYGTITSTAKTRREWTEAEPRLRTLLNRQSESFDVAAGHYLLASMKEDSVGADREIRQARVALSRAKQDPAAAGLALLLDLFQPAREFRVGNWHAAEREYEGMISKAPTALTAGTAIHGLFAVGKATGELPRIMRRIEQLAKSHPGSELEAAALHRIGQFQLENKDYRGARIALERLKKNFPDSAALAEAMLAQIPQKKGLAPASWLWISAVLLVMAVISGLIWHRLTHPPTGKERT